MTPEQKNAARADRAGRALDAYRLDRIHEGTPIPKFCPVVSALDLIGDLMHFLKRQDIRPEFGMERVVEVAWEEYDQEIAAELGVNPGPRMF